MRSRLVAGFVDHGVPLMRRLLVVAPLLGVGCSLLGLNDYAIPACNYVVGVVVDDCKGLCRDGNCVGCMTYQCNPASHRCELSAVDDDHDLDPSIACVGTDCDDYDAKRAGKTQETCDGIDNNCNELVDEELLWSGAVTNLTYFAVHDATTPAVVRDSSGATLASFVVQDGTKDCITVVSDGVQASGGAYCTAFPADPGVPRQPYSRVVGESFPDAVVTVYSRVDGCEGLALRSTSGAAIDPTCADGPASLPSFSPVDDQVHASNIVVTHYMAPIAATCADVLPAPLVLRFVSGADTSAAMLSPPLTLSPASASMRPAAHAWLPLSHAVLVAAPDEASGVALWVVKNDATLSARKLGLGTVLTGARSVDVAVGTSTEAHTTPFGVVAEIGCPPYQPIVLALGVLLLDDADAVLGAQVRAVIPITTAWTNAASPSIGWEGAPYDEWRVTWIFDAVPNLQRLTLGGVMVGGPIGMGTGSELVAAAAYGSHANVVMVPTGQFDANVASVALGCRK